MILRTACGRCRATGASWCTHAAPAPPQRVIRTSWWLPFYKINWLEDLEGPPMCKQQATGIMPSFLIGRGQRQPAPCQCQAAKPTLGQRFDAATHKANKVLIGVGLVALPSVIGLIIHVLVIAVFVTLTLALSGVTIGLLVKQRRRRVALPVFAPAPEVVTAAAPALAAAARRQVSCEVTVLAIGSPEPAPIRGHG